MTIINNFILWLQKQKIAYHKHEGFPEHPVAVKYHQEWFFHLHQTAISTPQKVSEFAQRQLFKLPLHVDQALANQKSPFKKSWEAQAKALGTNISSLQESVEKHIQILLNRSSVWKRIQLPKLAEMLTVEYMAGPRSVADLFEEDIRENYLEDLNEYTRKVFGYKGKRHPIYGYISESPLGDGDNLSEYGSIRIKFKPIVKKQTTVTVGDSYGNKNDITNNADVIPQPITNFQWSGINPINAKNALEAKISQEISADEYVEAQIYNRLGLDMIEEIIFEKTPPLKIKEALRTKGILIRVIKTGI